VGQRRADALLDKGHLSLDGALGVEEQANGAILGGVVPHGQLPVELLLGKHHGAGLLLVLATQLAWAVVLFGAGRMVLAAAVRKVVVQGG